MILDSGYPNPLFSFPLFFLFWLLEQDTLVCIFFLNERTANATYTLASESLVITVLILIDRDIECWNRSTLSTILALHVKPTSPRSKRYRLALIS